MSGRIVIVGGGPAGIITALTARSVYPDHPVLLIKSIGDGVIPCAIPYMVDTLSSPEQNAMGDPPLLNAGVEVRVDRMTGLDREAQVITLERGAPVSYEKLVLALGTESVLPSIPGVHLPGVFTIHKSMTSMRELRDELREAKRVVIIGGGFIGVEFADELQHLPGLRVDLVETLPHLLMSAFDDELCLRIEQELRDRGIQVHLSERVAQIDGNARVQSVTLDSGEVLDADTVLVGVGARPESAIADQAGLRVTDRGAIWVDDYLRTTDPHIFAVGDCALKRDFFTRREVSVLLASTATSEARIAGTNLYQIRVLRQIQGTVAAFSTRLGGTAYASAGLTCRECRAQGFRCVTATAVAPDRHPGVLPGARPLSVKLVFADRSGILLGGQLRGGPSVGELINLVALGIQKRVTVRELDMMQIATHPLLTSAPTVHPLINAAHQALAKLRGKGDGLR